jgi:hypothetical protein
LGFVISSEAKPRKGAPEALAVVIYLKGQSTPIDLQSGTQASWHHAQALGGGSFTNVLLQVKDDDGVVVAEFIMSELAGYEVKPDRSTS